MIFGSALSAIIRSTLLFLNSEGKEVHRSVGAPREVKDYISLGLMALNPLERLLSYDVLWNKGNRDFDFVIKYLEKRKDAALPNGEIIDEYYLSLSDEELMSDNAWNIIYKYDQSIDSKGMKRLLDKRAEYGGRHGKNKVDERLYKNYLNHLYSKVNSKDFSMKEMELTMIEIKKKQVPYWEKIILLGDLAHLKRVEKYKEYCEVATDDVGEYFNDDPNALNEFAWNVFEWSNKKKELEIATAWAKTALELEDEPMIRDTYANLLYKTGKKEEARAEQQKAIDQLKAEGEDTSDYEQTLESFK